MPRKPSRVAFFHLDLGVGGAEQLVLQTALQTYNILEGTRRRPCPVDLFTTYFDTRRCLEASKDRKTYTNMNTIFVDLVNQVAARLPYQPAAYNAFHRDRLVTFRRATGNKKASNKLTAV